MNRQQTAERQRLYEAQVLSLAYRFGGDVTMKQIAGRYGHKAALKRLLKQGRMHLAADRSRYIVSDLGALHAL